MNRISVRGAVVATATALGLVGSTIGMSAWAEDNPAPTASKVAAAPLGHLAAPVNVPAAHASAAAAAQKAAQQAAAKVAAQKAAAQKAAAQKVAAQKVAAQKAAAQKAAAQKAAATKAAEKKAAAQKAAAKKAAAKKAAAKKAAKKAAARRKGDQRASRSSTRSGTPRDIARAMVADGGWSSRQYTCLDSLWQRESGWRVSAQNSSSGAYGIPQALPGSKMASAGSNWRSSAATQIEWGLGYIRSVYGTPCSALSASNSKGWY